MDTWLSRGSSDEPVHHEPRLVERWPTEHLVSREVFLQAVEAEDRDRVEQELERCLREGGELEVEFRATWPEGNPCWLKVQSKVVTAPDGHLFFMGGSVDITDRQGRKEALHETDWRKDKRMGLPGHTPATADRATRRRWMSLTQQRDRLAAALMEGEIAGERPRGLKVLVVEDHEDTAETTAQLLRLCGHHVAIALDSHTAIEAAEEHQPDVVLLDISLPQMDGCLVARWIYARCQWRRPLLIAITGSARKNDRQRASEAGIDLYLTKPADPLQLRWLLRRFQTTLLADQADLAEKR